MNGDYNTREVEQMAQHREGFVYMVRGTDENGVWFLGPGDRKVGVLEMAIRMSARATAERIAVQMGGEVFE
jgi:hypothetical protein